MTTDTTEKVAIENEPVNAPEGAPEDGRPRRAAFTAAGLVRGVDVELQNAVVGAVMAADDVHIQNGGARSIFAGGALDLSRGGAGIIVAGGDTHIRQGGAQAVLSAGGITMEQAGSGFAIARRIRIGHGGMTIFAITPKLEAADGARVVVGPAGSLALLAGILALVATAILRRRRHTDEG
jgi:hypothetical protein